MSEISIMIVDPEADRAASLAAVFRSRKDITVVAAVENRAAALRQLSRAPSVMLLHADVLKRYSLARFLNALRDRSAGTRLVLLFPAAQDDERIVEAIRLGARGYLAASATPSFIVKAVRAVAAGEVWAERRILEKAIGADQTLVPERHPRQVPEIRDLTDRERDMLSQVLKGATNREIAAMSSISERTVKTHLYRVYRKLHVKSRTKAIALLSH